MLKEANYEPEYVPGVSVQEPQLRRLATGVICVCVALVLATSAAVAFPRFRHLLGFSADAQAYRIGELIDVPRETYDQTPQSLIIFARADCEACQAARPVLAALVEQVQHDSNFRIVLLMPSRSPSEGLDYVRSLGLQESSFVPRALKDHRVRAVPTALLVDRDGTILAMSEGLGDPFHALTRLVLSRVSAF